MCKKLFSVLLVFNLFLLVFYRNVGAHGANQPPHFMINGKYADYYNVPIAASSGKFEIPIDAALEKYLVSKSINFEIDTSKLPISPEVATQTVFLWDFGDGTKKEGVEHTHAYRNIGTYIIKVETQTNPGYPPELLDSVLLHVLPDNNYELPQSTIWINGWTSKDPLIDIFRTDFSEELEFGKSQSMQMSSNPNVNYEWDFGDGNYSANATAKHRYSTKPWIVFVILRVKDGNGFFVDSYVQLSRSDEINTTQKGKEEGSNIPPLKNILISSFFILLAAIIGFRIYKLKSQ